MRAKDLDVLTHSVLNSKSFRSQQRPKFLQPGLDEPSWQIRPYRAYICTMILTSSLCSSLSGGIMITILLPLSDGRSTARWSKFVVNGINK